VPLAEVATVKLTRGPTTIRTENGQLAACIFVEIRDRDLGGYVAEAQKAVAANVVFSSGTYVTWSGQFEYLEQVGADVPPTRPSYFAARETAFGPVQAPPRKPRRPVVGEHLSPGDVANRRRRRGAPG
jgi:hypothetical protein